MGIIDFDAATFIFLDPLGTGAERELVIHNAINSLFGTPFELKQVEFWKQQNLYDCGVFVIQWIKHSVIGWPLHQVFQEQMLFFRYQMTRELVHNTIETEHSPIQLKWFELYTNAIDSFKSDVRISNLCFLIPSNWSRFPNSPI